MYLVLGASILPLFTIFLLDYLTVSESIFSSYYITLNIFYCQAIIQKIDQTLLINLRGLLRFILFNQVHVFSSYKLMFGVQLFFRRYVLKPDNVQQIKIGTYILHSTYGNQIFIKYLMYFFFFKQQILSVLQVHLYKMYFICTIKIHGFIFFI